MDDKHDGSGGTPRRPTRVLPALSQADGTLRRLVGGVDARGGGTTFPIMEVGPFILVGEARDLMGAEQPPFGAHPHAGLVALSHVPSGAPWESRANVPGLELLPFTVGDVVMTLAGRGIVHDEPTVGDGAHDLLQIILRLPAETRDAAAAIRRWRAVRLADGVSRLFNSEQLVETGLDAAAYLVRVPAGGSVELELSSAHTAGFVYARSGCVDVSGRRLQPHDVAVLGSEGDVLWLAADCDHEVECLVAVGAPVAGPWAKLVGHNGFVVAADEAGAAAALARYGRDGSRFGW